MEGIGLSFAPTLPWALIGALGALAVVGVALTWYYRLSGWWLRALAFAIILGALAGPQLKREERVGLPNVAFLVVDKSASTGFGERADQIGAAAREITGRINGLSTASDPFELITVEVDNLTEGTDRGTRLLTALDEASARVAPGQIAGAVLLTDGQVHDPDRLASFPGPVHNLLAGQEGEFDVRLVLDTAPAFGIVGQEVTFQVHVDALGELPGDIGTRLPAQISIDGGEPEPLLLKIGELTNLAVEIEHGGPTVVDIMVEPHEGEITERNNRIIATVNGVRDRLRVLLVSGEPHPGGRTWRDLLKSDPTVELIHFTILRPPAKQDGTPVSELSLIAFPTRELFLEKIDGFDLIVFDRYRWRGVLSTGYLANVARYVREGGAVLVASGPAFSGAQSLSRTPLDDVLPAAPTVEVIERPFMPTVTDMGQRHPVTSGLGGGGSWGEWLRQIDVTPRSGHVVMSGDEGRPLLILDRVDEGRVALLASDHAWLWSRGYDGGGPQADLLRRVAHWLMREPELEEEALFARVEGTRVLIERRSLADEGPDAVTAHPPDDSTSVTLDYTEVAPGRWQTILEDAGEGLWRFDDGAETAVAAVGPPSPLEFANPLASGELLAPLVLATNGRTEWLSDGIPSVRAISEGRRAGGRNWIGLTRREAYRVTGVRLTPMLPAWLAALAVGLVLLAGWLREGR